jgi:hypothetical protein
MARDNWTTQEIRDIIESVKVPMIKRNDWTNQEILDIQSFQDNHIP